ERPQVREETPKRASTALGAAGGDISFCLRTIKCATRKRALSEQHATLRRLSVAAHPLARSACGWECDTDAADDRLADDRLADDRCAAKEICSWSAVLNSGVFPCRSIAWRAFRRRASSFRTGMGWM